MYGLALFACPMCAMSSPIMVWLSIGFGGVPVSYWLLRPAVRRISNVWGWPRMNVSGCVSLALLLVWPGLLGWMGLQNHGIPRVAICTAGLALCAIYLWIRGSWLLQQCGAATWGRQILLFGFLGQAALIAGDFVGQSILGLIYLALIWPGQAIPWFLANGVVAAILLAVVYGGFRYVFWDRNVADEPYLCEEHD